MTRYAESIKRQEIETLITDLTGNNGILISKQTIINNCMRKFKANKSKVNSVLQSMVSRGMLVSRREGRKIFYISKLSTI